MVNKTILKLLVFVLNGCSMVQIVSFNIVISWVSASQVPEVKIAIEFHPKTQTKKKKKI